MRRWIVPIILFAIAMILLIYNIIKYNHTKLNIALILGTYIITFIIELGTLPFTASNDKKIMGASIDELARISGITPFLLLGILIIVSVICLKYLKNKTMMNNHKYIIGITILVIIIFYKLIPTYMKTDGIIGMPADIGRLYEYTEVEILEYKINEYLKIMPEYILYIQIFILLIMSNFKKIIKEEKNE